MKITRTICVQKNEVLVTYASENAKLSFVAQVIEGYTHIGIYVEDNFMEWFETKYDANADGDTIAFDFNGVAKSLDEFKSEIKKLDAVVDGAVRKYLRLKEEIEDWAREQA